MKNSAPLFGLGIDAGGTFTDAVIVDIHGSEILAQTKAPTTSQSPLKGIREALAGLPPEALRKAHFVSLATTFATNAIVQGRGARAGLILIGYDRDHPALSKMSPVLFMNGGHNYWGEEASPLETDRLANGLPELIKKVDAIAVSGYFSVRNPEHENRVADYIAEQCSLPVVLGHQLSVRLDAPKRATTAWWNARLIPLINLLIDNTSEVLEEFHITAPLLVVRGDGTLMAVREAKRRPVETILSGPAASILGARFLTRTGDGIVVDMGGTTTDMAILKRGKVEIDPAGARVGEWMTQVEAARIRTTGLGGDSAVHVKDGTVTGLRVGPERVEPLCTMAKRYPDILKTLKRLDGLKTRIPLLLYDPCTFYVEEKAGSLLSQGTEKRFFRGAANEYELLSHTPSLNKWDLNRLVNQGSITRTGLTPTDFCVANNTYDLGSREAARIAISILARGLGVEEMVLYRAVEKEIARRLCVEAVNLSFNKDAAPLLSLMDHWFFNGTAGRSKETRLELSVKLTTPVLGIGAPARAWLPRAFDHLQGSCKLPGHFMVGTAIGAAVGTVGFTLTAEIRPTPREKHILYSPEGKVEYNDFETAVQEGREQLESMAKRRMQANDVREPLLDFTLERRSVPIPGGELYLCTILTVQATGRVAVDEGYE